MPKIDIKQKEGEEEVTQDVFVSAILDIQKAMDTLSKSRLKRSTIVTLIHSTSKVAKRDIEIVLNNLDSLEETFLKPKI